MTTSEDTDRDDPAPPRTGRRESSGEWPPDTGRGIRA